VALVIRHVRVLRERVLIDRRADGPGVEAQTTVGAAAQPAVRRGPSQMAAKVALHVLSDVTSTVWSHSFPSTSRPLMKPNPASGVA